LGELKTVSCHYVCGVLPCDAIGVDPDALLSGRSGGTYYDNQNSIQTHIEKWLMSKVPRSPIREPAYSALTEVRVLIAAVLDELFR